MPFRNIGGWDRVLNTGFRVSCGFVVDGIDGKADGEVLVRRVTRWVS